MRYLPIFVIGVGLAAALCSCGEEVKGLKEEIKMVKEENSFLKAENRGLKKEVEELYERLEGQTQTQKGTRSGAFDQKATATATAKNPATVIPPKQGTQSDQKPAVPVDKKPVGATVKKPPTPAAKKPVAVPGYIESSSPD